ncbi:cbb3-type cytochrome c oxidase N-terminal domain-containing protein [Lutibacter sp.]|uniref:cbb3-type cytochrome c oxidase N-terminal domain-containing protein n=1 Tax=Lutibacter sp. TaxID=1925666 RepID=UPI0027363D64|nr:cbb3-type cytochrome c oxidase N-terminal domain-containing protein [Lutibacter sp.]MDP3312410.1 cbb3-type cytochrome c oxidase N-terminal domain-containing protein [Lutibacter sp.]
MNKNSENISGWKKFWKSLTKAHDLGTEEDILLDHDYDGIKELDNVLPPWWLYGFYITIAASIFYYVMIFGFDKYNQFDEFNTEMTDAKAAVEQYKADNPQLFSTENLEVLTSEEDLAKGKELFTTKTCVVCHLADLGGSVGPNLTDNQWILGGDMKSIFNTIAKGGRPGKGMIAWEGTLSKEERQLLSSYIISMQGTKPAAPKAAEGDIIWPEAVVDSLNTKVDSIAPVK